MMNIVTKTLSAADRSTSPAELSDEAIVLRYQETGDQADFAELVHRYERELYSFLRRYLGDAEMAEDAFQATFLQLHLKCDQFDTSRRLRPWLYMIATNKAIDLQRRNKRHQAVSLNGVRVGGDSEETRLVDVLVGDDADPMKQLSQAESGEWISEKLSDLPEHLRLVVHLVYFQGLKYREAAEVISIPVGTVKSRLHAAVAKLTDAWAETHQDDRVDTRYET